MPRQSSKTAKQPRNTPLSDRRNGPGQLSHERIAADVDAFCNAGGQIEVLGNTPFRPKLTPEKPAASATAIGDGTEKPRSHKRK